MKDLRKQSEINPVAPVNPVNNNNYQHPYYPPKDKNKQPAKKQDKPRGDYFEKSNDDPEYFYKPDGSFKETRCEMKRLIRKESASTVVPGPITERTKLDVPGFIPGPPPYATGVDSYTSYLMQNPDNKYIKRLRGQEVQDTSPDGIKYMSDVMEEYMDGDDFTVKKTK